MKRLLLMLLPMIAYGQVAPPPSALDNWPTANTTLTLADPSANTIVGWDDTDNKFVHITIGSGLTYTRGVGPTYTLTSAGGPGGATPTGTGFYHVTGGVMDSAAVSETGSSTVVRSTSPNITDGRFFQTGATTSILYGVRFSDTTPGTQTGFLLNFFNQPQSAPIWQVSNAGQTIISLSANNLTGLKITRNTDTSPTGNFLDFKNAAGTSIYTVDITGAWTNPSFTNVTTGNATTSAHGLLPALDGNTAHFLNGNGGWTTPTGSGGIAADTFWAAKGDLAVATANDAASVLSVGTNNQVLTADSTQTTGVKWATPAAGGTLTATGLSLPNNAVVLGNTYPDTKVSTGITTDGSSVLNLGSNATVAGVKIYNAGNWASTIVNNSLNTSTLTMTLPATTTTLVGKDTTDILSNKTLDNPIVGGSAITVGLRLRNSGNQDTTLLPTSSGTPTITFPATTTTLVGTGTADALTNKTLDNTSHVDSTGLLFWSTGNVGITLKRGGASGSPFTVTLPEATTTLLGTNAIGSTVEAWDTDLDTWAGITPATNVGTFLATPSSANLRAALTDENGTGAALFNGATSPDFTTGFTIGGSASTSRKIVVSDGTRFVPSTETHAVPGTSGNVMTSDGTNWTSAAPVVTTNNAATLTSKRINPRVTSIASNATLSPDVSTDDEYNVYALTVPITVVTNPAGSPVEGQKLIIRLKSASAQGISGWGSNYRFSSDLPAPSTTVAGKGMYLGFIYTTENSTVTKWDCVAIINNF